jgi:hypothetical protein
LFGDHHSDKYHWYWGRFNKILVNKWSRLGWIGTEKLDMAGSEPENVGFKWIGTGKIKFRLELF